MTWVTQLGGDSQTPSPSAVLRSESSRKGKTQAEAHLGLGGGGWEGSMHGLQGRLSAAPASGVWSASSRASCPCLQVGLQGGCDPRGGRRCLPVLHPSKLCPCPQAPHGLSEAQAWPQGPCHGAVKGRDGVSPARRPPLGCLSGTSEKVQSCLLLPGWGEVRQGVPKQTGCSELA